MGFGSRRAHDMSYRNAANGERVRNEGAVASPGDGLGAHHSHLFFTAKSDQLLKALFELGRLHVIGEASKRCILPARVLRILMRMAQAAERCQMRVMDPSVVECG